MKTKQILAMLAVWVAGLGASALAMTIYADSQLGFSNTQGVNGWSYSLWHQPTGQFHDLTVYSGDAWREGDGAVWKEGMHPHSTDWLVLRDWVSTVTGEVTVSGTAELFTSNAAGVNLTIFRNNVGTSTVEQKWTDSLSASQSLTHDVTFWVNQGDWIMLGIIGNGGISNDATNWAVQVTSVPEPAMLSLVALGALAVMQRRRRA